jgi:hypothetical protein
MNKSYLKLSLFSIIFFLVYLFFTKSEKTNSTLLMLQESNSSRAFGYFVLFNLLKYFLLLFSIIALMFLVLKLFKNKWCT